jgi:capsular polysaccharide biosynthesis protein/MinD-like ATPase involved in chromosome partitioning or flagellar assembly
MDAARPVGYDTSDYLGMLRRHWWIVVLLTVAGLGGALAFAHTQPHVYESSSSVLVMPTGTQDTNAAGGRTANMINLDTEAQLVGSMDTAAAAGQLMKVDTPPAQLAANVTVTVPANTTVLTITYASGSPQAAQAGSHAFAAAYLHNRQNTAQADLTGQISALDGKVKQFSDLLAQLSSKVATLQNNDPTRADLNSQINSLTNQINALSGKENTLSTTQVTAGRIISDATLPRKAIRPSIPLFLASGAMVGLLLGLSIAVVRERADPRVRRAVDVTRRGDIPVLTELPKRTRYRADDVFASHSAAGRLFGRLRNEVLASLGDGDQVLVVTGVSRGMASSLVAANVAAALARAGSAVVLVCANTPESAGAQLTAPRMPGATATPGLSDVLAGTATLDAAVRPAARVPGLRVLGAGGTASAGGLLQSQSLRDTIDELRERAGYVVVDAPSTAVGADAQSLASRADAAIVAVELRHSTHVEVLDAAEQVRRVGTALLGAVVLPRITKFDGTANPPSPRPAVPVHSGQSTVDTHRTGTRRPNPSRAARGGRSRGAGVEEHDAALAADLAGGLRGVHGLPPGGEGGSAAMDETVVLTGIDQTVVFERVDGDPAG